MRRREFIGGLGAAAVASAPLASRAQQAGRMRRVGVLQPGSANDQSARVTIVALWQGLKNLGWIEGRNLQLEIRFAGGDPRAIVSYADELVSLAPEVIVAGSGAATRALQQKTHVIPIVITRGGDPVESGYAKSMARPEGNITGIANLYPSIGGRWLELIKDASPRVTSTAILLGQNSRGRYVASIEAAATALAMHAIRTPFGGAAELERAIEAFAVQPNGSLILHPPGPVGTDRELVFRLAREHRLPTVYQERSYVVDGGLMSYGSSDADNMRQAASFVDRILRGAKPGDLPVQFPTKFELVINLKTAKALGLAVPETLLAFADEVIEQ
jgi:putative tryptophan/tyrosine transport system substrate-binding protein